MSDIFFQQLRIPAPEINLQVGSGGHARQTAEVMSRFEPVVLEHRPDYVLVYGDVNSTVAAALVCSKLDIRIAHVEAGLRSFDRSMPEEINRILTDQLADLLFTPSEDGSVNLRREGRSDRDIHYVGNVMIDTLIEMLAESDKHVLPGLPSKFALVTLHRPANVDDLSWLQDMLVNLQAISLELPILFPVHPRTRQRISEICVLSEKKSGVRLLDPLPYLSFLALQKRAEVVITDSGGIQEETTYLRIPCLTVRENTERPVTVERGTNLLVGRDVKRLRREVERILSGQKKAGSVPALWDGKAARRICRVLLSMASRDCDPADSRDDSTVSVPNEYAVS